MAGIYIHIPFCKQACYYCDFHFSTNREKQQELVQAICAEAAMQKKYLGDEVVETIYFGGGTPSLLSQQQVTAILDALRKNFNLAPVELTIEANPDDLSPEKLRELRDAGVNRLSIGIQSFDDAVLKFLNRAHDSHLAERCVHHAHAAGFDNISIDLIYAIPGQSEEQWRSNIKKALLLNPQHISSYSLTIEQKTVFGQWAAKGKLTPLSDDDTASQMDLLSDILERDGYLHYEVSNFAKAGFESRHNSSYWKGTRYLGLGPSAHSYNGPSRQYNVSNNHQYLKSISQSVVPATVEILSTEDMVNEYLLTSLRTSWGTDLTRLSKEHGYDLMHVRQEYIGTLLDNELATVHDGVMYLTKKGRLLADKIAAELFL